MPKNRAPRGATRRGSRGRQATAGAPGERQTRTPRVSRESKARMGVQEHGSRAKSGAANVAGYVDSFAAQDVSEQIEQIEGRHPVLEALKAGRPLTTLYLLKGGEGDAFSALQRVAGERNITVRWSSREELDRQSAGRAHQGVIAVAMAKALCTVEDLLEVAAARGESPFILVLDGVEDPQNVGSLLRSAEAAGCHGLIMRERRAAGITPTLLKAAAGAWEHLPVARVVNIARALDELKEAGVWIVGADMSGEVAYQSDLRRPLALVVGSEGEGLSRLVRQRCDILVGLPMFGRIGSLNVGVAGGVLLFEIVRQMRFRLREV